MDKEHLDHFLEFARQDVSVRALGESPCSLVSKFKLTLFTFHAVPT